jgi:hypothetical protein
MRLFAVACIAWWLIGCTAHVPSYQASGDYPSLRGLDKKVKVVANAPGFKDEGTILCRAAATVELPGKQTFTAYIASALNKELAAADLASETTDLVLTMKLEKVNFSTSLGATNWFIDGRYEIDGQVMLISTVYNDRSSYLGNKACDNIAAYFQKAIAAHFRQLFSEPVLKQKLTSSK